jgi:hypothetical protein
MAHGHGVAGANASNRTPRSSAHLRIPGPARIPRANGGAGAAPQKIAFEIRKQWCAIPGLNLEPESSSDIWCHRVLETLSDDADRHRRLRGPDVGIGSSAVGIYLRTSAAHMGGQTIEENNDDQPQSFPRGCRGEWSQDKQSTNRRVSNDSADVWRSRCGQFGVGRRYRPGRRRPTSVVPRATFASRPASKLGHGCLPHLVLHRSLEGAD